ncbi:MAG: DUF5106 domain-containing protein [Marinoscillum sp.]
MNKYSLLITFFIHFGFLQAQDQKVSFEIAGFPDTVAYIGYHFGNQKYLIDTLSVSNDQFELELSEVKEGIYFIYSPNYYLEFILEDTTFSLSTTKEGSYRELEVGGSLENQIFKEFQMTMGNLQRKQKEAFDLLKTESFDDSLRLREDYKSLAEDMDQYKSDVINNNPGTFMAAFLKLMINITPPIFEGTDQEKRQKSYDYLVQHYFDSVDLSDPRLLRTPLLHAKVMEYFEKLVVQEPDSINKSLDRLFARVGENEELFRYWLVSLFKKYAESKVMGMDAVMVHLIRNYYLSGRADWITDEYEKQLREEVAYLEHNLIGKQAPPLNVVDTLLQTFQLNQVASPYTLLFIYDPDCGHCKKSAKELEEKDADLYNLDIQVVAVCTTTDVPRWKKFIDEHNPMWTHAIDPTGKSYFRVYYNVRSTPQVYLLDERKTIIAKRLEIDQILDLVRHREQ